MSTEPETQTPLCNAKMMFGAFKRADGSVFAGNAVPADFARALERLLMEVRSGNYSRGFGVICQHGYSTRLLYCVHCRDAHIDAGLERIKREHCA